MAVTLQWMLAVPARNGRAQRTWMDRSVTSDAAATPCLLEGGQCPCALARVTR